MCNYLFYSPLDDYACLVGHASEFVKCRWHAYQVEQGQFDSINTVELLEVKEIRFSRGQDILKHIIENNKKLNILFF